VPADGSGHGHLEGGPRAVPAHRRARRRRGGPPAERRRQETHQRPTSLPRERRVPPPPLHDHKEWGAAPVDLLDRAGAAPVAYLSIGSCPWPSRFWRAMWTATPPRPLYVFPQNGHFARGIPLPPGGVVSSSLFRFARGGASRRLQLRRSRSSSSVSSSFTGYAPDREARAWAMANQSRASVASGPSRRRISSARTYTLAARTT